jgi:hypothetical protein
MTADFKRAKVTIDTKIETLEFGLEKFTADETKM